MKDRVQFYQDTVKDILEQAKQKGATEAEVALAAGTGFSVSVRNQTVETVENQQDQGMAITVYFDKRKGSADTGDLSQQSLLATLDAACSIANFTLEDPYTGLPDAQFLATAKRDLSLDHPYSGTIDTAMALALECEKIGLGFDSRIHNSEGASFSTYQGLNVYGNSLGFLSANTATHHSLSVSLLATGDNGSKERDYSYSSARDAIDLWPAETIATEAAQHVLRRLNPRRLKTQKAPVIFAAHLAPGLIRNYFNAVAGGALYRKTSFLLDSLGTQVFPDFINIYEDPFILKALGSAPFDAEGVAIQPQYLVEAGKVSQYLLSSYTARHLGMQTTGHAGGVRNIFIQSEQKPSFTEMLAEMGTGLIVTELIGQGVNPVTGDYSRGASGLWVENGQIQFPVSEITIASNLKNMFKNIQAVAADTETRDKVQVGSILIREMMIAGE